MGSAFFLNYLRTDATQVWGGYALSPMAVMALRSLIRS